MLRTPKKWFWLSWIIIFASVFVIVFFPPQLGIDFTGGSLVELGGENLDRQAITTALQQEAGITAVVQTTQENSVLIKSTPLSPEQHQALLDATIKAGLANEELRFETIGPTIGIELRRKALIAIGLAVLTMIVYLAYTFRKTSGMIAPWKFGVAAAIALLHDLLLVTALFGILSRFTSASIDSLFITALLAILGYSVNDTIVIFNRLREEWLRDRTGDLADIIDAAAKATLTRSLNTSFTTLLVLTTLLIFGGSTTRWFIVALTAGTIVGTYSSIFVAPPMLHFLATRNNK